MKKLFTACLIFLLKPLPLTAGEGASAAGWLKLLHYEKTSSGYISSVENKDFFLTSVGRFSPSDEYHAALAAFNSPTDRNKCDFPARFLYLKQKGLVFGDLSNCKEYQNFLNDVQPNAVTVLFTNAYMGNPSSMFGHTLFRIDTKRKGTQLLAHGANFGADTGDETGILYAVKGLYGGYYGTFGIKPYYDVINLYNNIENRDIWEYTLNFSPDELNLFTAHLWEMKNAKIRYYFASKNCSYVLLQMLEATKPELELSQNFRYYAIPLETLKTMNRTDGLIKTVNYRPSRQSKLKHRAVLMSKTQKETFSKIIKKDNLDLSLLSENQKADVLETAYQYIQYQYVAGNLELSDYRKKSLKLLHERSKIANQKQFFNELNQGENPILSHESMQAGLTFGTKNGTFFQEISYKPLYNSLMENSYGLLNGAEINMFETKIRHYDNKNKYVLEELNILKIKSLLETDLMFSPFSYDLEGGIKRLYDPKTKQAHTTAQINLGAGKSFAIAQNTLFYALSVPNAGYSGAIAGNGYVGFGLKGGIYYNSQKTRLNFSAQQNFTTADITRGQTYQAEAACGLTKNLNLYGSCKLFRSQNHNDKEISLGVKINF